MKITKLILSTSLLLTINNCFAQNATTAAPGFERFYISLTGGAGFPLGEFATYDPNPQDLPNGNWLSNHDIAGEAQTGITGRLSASYFFSKYLGGTAALFAGTYKAKDKNAYESGYPLPIGWINTTFNYDATSWKTNGAMIGLIARAPGKNVDFSIKLLGGMQQAVTPEINILITGERRTFDLPFSTVTYYPGSLEDTKHIPATSSTYLAWDAGMELKIKASSKISILLSADYTTSNVDFVFSENVISTYYTSCDKGPGNFTEFYAQSEYAIEHTRKISYISVATGIAYTFK